MKQEKEHLESSVSRVTASKKRKYNRVSEEPSALIERTCKILDAYIIEIMPDGEATHVQILNVVAQDIHDESVIKLALTISDLEKLGVEVSSKGLIDMCSWFKTFNSVFNVVMSDDQTEISVDEIFTAKLPKKDLTSAPTGESTKEVNLISEAAGVESIIKIKKFGRNK